MKCRYNKPGVKFTSIKKKILKILLKIRRYQKKKTAYKLVVNSQKFKNIQKIILESKSKALAIRQLKIYNSKTTFFS